MNNIDLYHSVEIDRLNASLLSHDRNDIDTINDDYKEECKDEWITAIAVVSFDIDEGQIIEHILPANVLGKGEQKLLSLLSFPDSNSFNAEGSIKYIFRLRRGIYNILQDIFGLIFDFIYICRLE